MTRAALSRRAPLAALPRLRGRKARSAQEKVSWETELKLR